MIDLRTREITGNIYRLRFEDDDYNSFYRIIESNNMRTVKRYAKKVERDHNWVLMDIVFFLIFDDSLIVTKYSIRYTMWSFRTVRLLNTEFQFCMDLGNGEIIFNVGIDLP